MSVILTYVHTHTVVSLGFKPASYRCYCLIMVVDYHNM